MDQAREKTKERREEEKKKRKKKRGVKAETCFFCSCV